jgi:hypothetical protein
LLRCARNDGEVVTKYTAVVPRGGGGSSTLRLIGSITAVSGILDHPPSRVMTGEYVSAFSRRIAPEVCIFVCPPLEQRAQGRPGACCTRGPACDLRKQNCTRAYRAAGASRPSLRNGVTAYFVLSPENGSFASVARAPYRKLSASTAAPEPHDFTVRSSCTRQSQLSRPSHLTARRDDGQRPSIG